jgi:hypothetical protein
LQIPNITFPAFSLLFFHFVLGTKKNLNLIIVIDGSLKSKKSGQPVASKDSIICYPLSNGVFEDGLVMLTDGVLAEIKVTKIQQVLGQTLQSLIQEQQNNQKKLSRQSSVRK